MSRGEIEINGRKICFWHNHDRVETYTDVPVTQQELDEIHAYMATLDFHMRESMRWIE